MPDEVIRIEPDWNVKFDIEELKNLMEYIRIEPDWNVKQLISSYTNSYSSLE